ncbi:MAG: hypothetical protein ACTSRK_17015 [Promethearchaeota archaeon]
MVKRIGIKKLEHHRVDLAFSLLDEGKISKKKAFKLSGLTYHDFMEQGEIRKVSEKIPDELIESELAAIHELDITQFLKIDDEQLKKLIL